MKTLTIVVGGGPAAAGINAVIAAATIDGDDMPEVRDWNWSAA